MIFTIILLFLTFLQSLQTRANAEIRVAQGSFDQEVHNKNPALIALPETITPNQDSFSTGFMLDLKSGWKTYWRSPGDAGLPLKIKLNEDSQNIDKVSIEYPFPHRLDLIGFITFGYGDQVIFPMEVSLTEKGASARLAGKISYLACEKICLPLEYSFDYLIPASAVSDAASVNADEAFLLAKAIAGIPEKIPFNLPNSSLNGLEISDLSLHKIDDFWQIYLRANSRHGWDKNSELLVEIGDDLPWSAPEMRLNGNAIEMMIKAPIEVNPQADAPITISLSDGKVSTEVTMKVVDILNRPMPTTSLQDKFYNFLPYVKIFVIALLGGLILNVMPCVLPVLSLKIIGLIGSKSQAISLIVTGLGIVTTFLFIGLVAYIMQLTGSVLGWGVQFQSPVFMVFLLSVLTLFACNLLGFWQFQLPAWMLNVKGFNRSESLIEQHEANTHPHSTKLGSFFTGVFITLMATPCSAPFLGTAVSFALAGSFFDIALIFIGLGLGMAAPYFIFAMNPRLFKILPKPGAWLGWVRPILAIPLILTMVWLLTVLSLQIEFNYLMVIISLLLFTFLILGLGRLLKNERVHKSGAKNGVMGALVVLSLGLALFISTQGKEQGLTPINNAESKIAWKAFAPQSIEHLVATNHIVFVNVTAKWCLTCKFNEVVVMEQKPILDIIEALSPIMMQADWTNPNPDISEYLRSFNRFGIPFNIIYSKSHPNGIILPEILTEKIVLEQFTIANNP